MAAKKKTSKTTGSEKKKEKKPVKPFRTKAVPTAYAWTAKPDTGNKFSDNKYKVTAIYDKDDDELDVLRKECEAVAKATFPDVPLKEIKMPFRDGTAEADKAKKNDKDKEEFRGKVLITAKTKDKPNVVDAKRKPLPKGVEARSGDIMKLAIAIAGYESTEKVKDRETGETVTETVYGVTLYLNAIQLIEKRNSGQGGVNMFDDEDGFDGSDYDAGDDREEDDDEDDDDDL